MNNSRCPKNGEGVLREENTKHPKLTIAHMEVNCGDLMPAESVSETG
ncbi:hypothetical protein SynRS9902_01184 [Synechococcus sp. RS9902]|nr:hypothetical protein SynRS9902_01184 [Synechococcus sp. RS9902]